MNAIAIVFTTYAAHADAIDHIRYQVFCQEQQIDPALDRDGLDPAIPQVLAYYQGQAVGTARLRSHTPSQVKLERVAVLAPYRRQGIGQAIVAESLTDLKRQGRQSVVLAAQRQSQTFYQQFGFLPQGPVFMEAGIEHVKMILRLEDWSAGPSI